MDYGDSLPAIQGVTDRVRRRPVRRVRAAGERDLRPHRRSHHPHHRLRLRARHGPADRRRPARTRCRLRPRVARQPHHADPRLRHVDGRHDRSRCRHRLRPVHRHPLQGGPQARLERRGVRRRVDRHERARRAVRWDDRRHLVDGSVPDRPDVRPGHGPGVSVRRDDDGPRRVDVAARAPRLGRHEDRQHQPRGADRRRHRHRRRVRRRHHRPVRRCSGPACSAPSPSWS